MINLHTQIRATSISILMHFFTWLPDKLYIKILFRLRMGYWFDVNNPNTFCEKLQWLKLYDRRSEYTRMVDKYLVKEYVSNIIGSDYIIPTLGVWETPEDIEWDNLPNQFVLKTTYGGGSSGVIICKDKAKLDRIQAIKRLKQAMKQDIYKTLKEWPYKNVKRRIIAEKLIETGKEDDGLQDYKFFCFNGTPYYCQVISGRGEKMCIDFFDMDWTHQPFHEPQKYPFASQEPKRPINFSQMKRFAATLAEGKQFSRIDFYEAQGQLYFGEITFFPTSGMGGFSPKEFDKKLGEMLILKKN